MIPVKSWKFWTLAAAIAVAAGVPLLMHNNYYLGILFRIALFAALGLAWDLVGGYAGQLSLGHVAFFGLGAYGLALLTDAGIPQWISLLFAAAIACALAALIGRVVFRLRGPYFTLATIAVAEVLRLTATNLDITKGAIGLDVPQLFSGSMRAKLFYLASLVLMLLVLGVNYLISRSRFGYYLLAIREDEETAGTVGIDTPKYKLRALLVSAFFTALGGGLAGSGLHYHIIPDSVFSLDMSVQIAIIAMLGGAGTLFGPIVGAVLLLSASEIFKTIFDESHLLIYGLLIVLVVLFLPEGIVGGLQHRLRSRFRPAVSTPAAKSEGAGP